MKNGDQNRAVPLLPRVIAPYDYDSLPLSWRESDLSRFSAGKTLYDYQQQALKDALRALWVYYKGDVADAYHPGDSPEADAARRRRFAALMAAQRDENEISPDDIVYKAKDKPFSVLAGRISPEGGKIPFWPLANRMGFWMATGSGKTPVMIKWIEILRRLMAESEIPRRKILVLAPGDLLVEQIHGTAREYNRDNRPPIHLVGLTEPESVADRNETRIYRADNISDVRKKALVDWRDYENGGKWYVLLDEAHRGQADDSKRQAYYSLLSRNGFLFNFSATFTDPEDIVTTVAKFNLGDFSAGGYGKRIYLSGQEFHPFARAKQGDYTGAEAERNKRKIVLMSLIAFAFASGRVDALRREAKKKGAGTLYHKPLLMTLTHSVNTDGHKNDLRAFFRVLSDLASATKKGVSEREFSEAKKELQRDFNSGRFEFEDLGVGDKLRVVGAQGLPRMTLDDLREAVFLDKRPGEFEVVEGARGREIAFQLKTAAEPFALIRIGDTSKWIKDFENERAFVTKRVAPNSYFKELNEGRLTILMGSRSFVESWDSVRPNVINFINVGVGKAAVKFILQSIGRGVRIRPASGCRRRFAASGDSIGKNEREILKANSQSAATAETLFVFATNRAAVGNALRGLETAQRDANQWRGIGDLFSKSKRPKVDGGRMPLLVPEYNDVPGCEKHPRSLAVSTDEGLRMVRELVQPLPDGVLAVGYGKSGEEISAFREMAQIQDAIFSTPGGAVLSSFPTALNAVFRHLRLRNVKKDAKILPLNEKEGEAHIVHFRNVSSSLGEERTALLRSAIEADNLRLRLKADYNDNKITLDEYTSKIEEIAAGVNAFGDDIEAKRIAKHYYLPLVVAKDGAKAEYIRHIVKHKSEAAFLQALESWLANNGHPKGWEWMFSKLEERVDKVFIPYLTPGEGEFRSHFPDFIFWLCQGDEYRIVFVDPHGTAHTDSIAKMNGFRELFEQPNGKPRQIPHDNGRWTVSARLLFFNLAPSGMEGAYGRHWTNNPGDIFKDG